MIFLILGLLTIVFLLSLMGYKKILNQIKSKAIEWVFWILFVMWTLGFILGGMSFIKNNYPDFNKVFAIAPVALAFVLFIFINRNQISSEGFNKKTIKK
ncbi:hypothetical protein D3C86_1738640 [compost metagenome]